MFGYNIIFSIENRVGAILAWSVTFYPWKIFISASRGKLFILISYFTKILIEKSYLIFYGKTKLSTFLWNACEIITFHSVRGNLPRNVYILFNFCQE